MKKDSIQNAACEIARLFSCETPLPDEVLHFLHSMLGEMSAAEIRQLLVDEDVPEREAFIELLLFPDDGFKAALEPVLEKARFGSGDEPALARALAALEAEARFRLPGGERFSLPLDEENAALVVRRLHIAANPPERLAAILDARLSPEAAAGAKVRLRCARFAHSSRNMGFLEAVLTGLADEGGFFRDVLEYVCLFLETAGEDADTLVLLRGRFEEARVNIRRAEMFQKLLAGSNMETLMMQGVRQPHADPDKLRLEMRMVDRICFAVHGVGAEVAPALMEVDLGLFNGEEGVKELLNIMD